MNEEKNKTKEIEIEKILENGSDKNSRQELRLNEEWAEK